MQTILYNAYYVLSYKEYDDEYKIRRYYCMECVCCVAFFQTMCVPESDAHLSLYI